MSNFYLFIICTIGLTTNKMGDSSPDINVERESKPIIIRNTTDLQRLKLEKLMKNPVCGFSRETFAFCK